MTVMRTLIKLVTIFALLLPLVSCQKEETQEDVLFSEKLFLSTNRLQKDFKTSFTAKTEWRIYSREDWITITSPSEGPAGKHTLTFSIKGLRTSTYYRKGYVYVETPNKRYDLSVEQGTKYNTHGQSNM